MTDVPKGLGATGKFPDGKANADDEGELQLAVGYDPSTRLVKLEFGKAVTWLGMKPEDAIALGQTLVKHGQRGQVANVIVPGNKIII